jgi:hypothetical protein
MKKVVAMTQVTERRFFMNAGWYYLPGKKKGAASRDGRSRR